ncbi:MAG: hypothetical protein HUU14_08430 [Dehalococcoidia bacterium]|nr:hypothetical protein [Chloroflexi bacterium CFX7]MCK6563122.1 hypothetical protein [Dehalococcoidia bacterium]MCL4232669.1 hypothetical protein [Dehalococcoidia bacterium]NUQ55894.1 hypothetical protein [Dehalococcoidia bacterium]RIL02881.1 MAG: hypothetical protein DCC78_05400 [bacterium]
MTINAPINDAALPRTGWRRFAPGGLAGGIIAVVILIAVVGGLLIAWPGAGQLSEPIDVPVRIGPSPAASGPTAEIADLETLAGVADIVVRGIVREEGTFRVTHVVDNHIGASVSTMTIQLPEAIPSGQEAILFLSSVHSPNSYTFNADERLFVPASARNGAWTVAEGRVSGQLTGWTGRSVGDFSKAIRSAPNPRDAAERLLRRYGFSPSRPDHVNYQLVGDQCTPGTAEEDATHDIGLHAGDATGPGVARVAWIPSAGGEPGLAAYVLVSGKNAVAAWLQVEKTGEVFSLKNRLAAERAAR